MPKKNRPPKKPTEEPDNSQRLLSQLRSKPIRIQRQPKPIELKPPPIDIAVDYSEVITRRGLPKQDPDIPYYVLLEAREKLTPKEYIIFICLCKHAIKNQSSPHYSCCWMTHRQLADETGVAFSMMLRHTKSIRTKGFIHFKHQFHHEGGFATSHKYEVRWMNDVIIQPKT